MRIFKKLRHVILFAVIVVIEVSCRAEHQPAFIGIQFIGQNGWIFGKHTYFSRDGGKRWQRSALSVDMEYSVYNVLNRAQFADEHVGFFSLDGFRKTTDGGRTWRRLADQNIGEIFFFDRSQGIGFSTRADPTKPSRYATGMHLTWDGGHTWEDVKQSPVAPWAHICFFTGKEIYAAQGTHFFHSLDSGRSWGLIKKLPESVRGLRKIGEEIWIVGNNGLCASYSPQSEILKLLSIPRERDGFGPDLFDVGLRNNFFIVTAYGGIYVRTADNPHWEKAKTDIRPWFLVSIDFAPDGTAFVVGGSDEPIWLQVWENHVLASKDYRVWKSVKLN